MTQVQQIEFAGAVLVVAFTLLYVVFAHVVLFRINQRLPPGERIRHGYMESALRGEVAEKYRSVFPDGRAPVIAEKARIVFWSIVLVWLVIRGLELLAGR